MVYRLIFLESLNNELYLYIYKFIHQVLIIQIRIIIYASCAYFCILLKIIIIRCFVDVKLWYFAEFFGIFMQMLYDGDITTI